MGSTFGTNVRVTVYGQSHSAGIGCVVEGLPAGEYVDMDQLAAFMARRAPGNADWSTPRKEADAPQVLGGLDPEGFTCGAPLAMAIANTNTRSGDYSNLKVTPRPGHADLTAQARWYGYQDVAGGGHFSGRLTAPICAAGGVALQILARQGIHVGAHIRRLAGIEDMPFDVVDLPLDELHVAGNRAFPVLDEAAGELMRAAIQEARSAEDSVGGVIEAAITGMPVGVGSPMFDGVENVLARALFGIPAVKGVEFGDGFGVADAKGSTNNDAYRVDGEGRVRPVSNHAGGSLGGITTGAPIIVRCAVKPTASIGMTQASVDLTKGEDAELVVHGRHDPCIVPRAVPVVEAVCGLAMLDMLVGDGRITPCSTHGLDPEALELHRRLFGF